MNFLVVSYKYDFPNLHYKDCTGSYHQTIYDYFEVIGEAYKCRTQKEKDGFKCSIYNLIED